MRRPQHRRRPSWARVGAYGSASLALLAGTVLVGFSITGFSASGWSATSTVPQGQLTTGVIPNATNVTSTTVTSSSGTYVQVSWTIPSATDVWGNQIVQASIVEGSNICTSPSSWTPVATVPAPTNTYQVPSGSNYQCYAIVEQGPGGWQSSLVPASGGGVTQANYTTQPEQFIVAGAVDYGTNYGTVYVRSGYPTDPNVAPSNPAPVTQFNGTPLLSWSSDPYNPIDGVALNPEGNTLLAVTGNGGQHGNECAIYTFQTSGATPVATAQPASGGCTAGTYAPGVWYYTQNGTNIKQYYWPTWNGPGTPWGGASHLVGPITQLVIPPTTSNGVIPYVEVGADGGIFNFDGAPFWGNSYRQGYSYDGPYNVNAYNDSGANLDCTGDEHDCAPTYYPWEMNGLAYTSNGQGYWTLTTNGSVDAFGNAQYVGEIAGLGQNPLGVSGNNPSANGSIASGVSGNGNGNYAAAIVPVPPGPNGSNGANGYWIVTAAGQIYNYGTAWWGNGYTEPDWPNNGPVVAAASFDQGQGIIVLTEDGNVYTIMAGQTSWQAVPTMSLGQSNIWTGSIVPYTPSVTAP